MILSNAARTVTRLIITIMLQVGRVCTKRPPHFPRNMMACFTIIISSSSSSSSSSFTVMIKIRIIPEMR